MSKQARQILLAVIRSLKLLVKLLEKIYMEQEI